MLLKYIPVLWYVVGFTETQTNEINYIINLYLSIIQNQLKDKLKAEEENHIQIKQTNKDLEDKYRDSSEVYQVQ